jgi:hypothetical protein
MWHNMNNESMSLSFSIMSVYKYYYSTKGTYVLCFMHKGIYLINLLIIQKHDMWVGATDPSQHPPIISTFLD